MLARKRKKTGKYIGIIAVLLLIAGLSFLLLKNPSSKVTEPKIDSEGGEVSWEKAIQILRSGEVRQATQLHNLTVTLIMSSGNIVTTTEPEIDQIFREIEQCGNVCQDIIVATE